MVPQKVEHQGAHVDLVLEGSDSLQVFRTDHPAHSKNRVGIRLDLIEGDLQLLASTEVGQEHAQ